MNKTKEQLVFRNQVFQFIENDNIINLEELGDYYSVVFGSVSIKNAHQYKNGNYNNFTIIFEVEYDFRDYNDNSSSGTVNDEIKVDDFYEFIINREFKDPLAKDSFLESVDEFVSNAMS